MELTAPRARRRVRRRRRAPTRAAVPLDPHAEAGLGPLVHAPWATLANRHPGPLPGRHAPRAHGRVAPTMPLGQPRATVRTARRVPMLRPCRDHCGCLAHQGIVDRYKGARVVPLARLRFPAAGLLYRHAPLKSTAELLAPLSFRANARP
jgi:hypothetical protein